MFPEPIQKTQRLKWNLSSVWPKCPFMQMLIDYRRLEALLPGIWEQMDKICLLKGDYLLWKTKHAYQNHATEERTQVQQIAFSFDMLTVEVTLRKIGQ